MKYFEPKSNTIWESKINFVDENNVFLGYDFSSGCCENFGWRILKSIDDPDKSNILFDETSDVEEINDFIKDYNFDINFLKQNLFSSQFEENNSVFFKLKNEDAELYICLYNTHNGYYTHGFEFIKDSQIIRNGNL